MSRDYKIHKENEGYPVYSFSKLSTYRHCKYAYFLQYIKKIRSKDNIYGILGTEVHEVAQDLVKGLITNKQAHKRFLDELNNVTEIYGLKFSSDKIYKNYKECMEHFILSYKPNHSKYEIERGFDVKVADSKAVMLGFIDLIYWNEDGTIDVVDYKTSSKFSKKDFQDKKMQLLAYAYALKQEGFKINKLYFNMIKYCKIEWTEVNSKKQKVTKTLQADRNTIGIKFQNVAKRLFKKMGVDETLSEIYIENMIKNNKINEQLIKEYGIIIKDFNVEVPCEEDDIQEFVDWFKETVNNMNIDFDKNNFEPCKIDKGSEFYCNLLCGLDCQYLNNYKNKNENSYTNRKKVELEESLLLEDLL